VKAFNTVFATFMHDTPADEPPPALVYSGDDDDAKEVVAELIRDLGFEPVDVGGAEATPWVETLAKLVITLAYGRGRGPFVYRFQPS
jgi:8-hydroxy-5-deazaflavin:NADPH oxidoreductase